jgi:type I restriction enzyme, R subunit
LEAGQTQLLVAMATGTGKTRLAISLIYRLIKTGRFRRVLFVVDRTALGEQAGDKFKETRLEELKTFDQIYDIKEVDNIEIEPTTNVNIATVQGLMRAILNPTEKRPPPSVGQYDCIIVDEAHRGYTLDRELGEDELPYRDQSDYLSKYRRAIDYFDAVKIGLTATPAPHTIGIFGNPVYTYTYREAVIDGWLIDHEPPHQLLIHLAKEGIKWKKGDTIPVYDPATGQITNIENIPDEVQLEIYQFNKLVVTDPYNRMVATELVKHLTPDGEAKTLIYAATDDHADMVVRILKEEFEAADIITFIRRQALGAPLVSHQARIQNAMTRIYAMRSWSAIQRQWLERIEKQLIAQTVLDREDFNQGAFAAHGGFNRLNKIFQGNFQQVLDDITATLYPDQREMA